MNTNAKAINTYAEPTRTDVKPINTYVKPMQAYVKPIKTNAETITAYVKPIKTYVKPIINPCKAYTKICNPRFKSITRFFFSYSFELLGTFVYQFDGF